MSEPFDVNLLSNVQALDKKLSISKEFVQLKRKNISDRRKKSGSYHGKKLLDEPDGDGYDDGADEDVSKRTIDITV
ncbi:MAG: hypothetical protein PHU49_14070 [Syntrophorhabdaceae bacterium]|nr:hypothetical protein [Syntrophorhabdaceae bacterium]MDD5245132.1 hypothetical protein [Syntrophorhabdaceae bacterium]